MHVGLHSGSTALYFPYFHVVTINLRGISMKIFSSHISRVVLILVALTGCSSSPSKVHNLYNVWFADSYTMSKASLNKVLILGVVNLPENRQKLEDAFTEAFINHGVEAIPSLKLMHTETDISRETVEFAIDGTGIDAVLVTELVRVDDADIYHGPDPTTYWNEKDFLTRIGYYDTTAYDYSTDPNLTSTKLVALVKIKLYDIDAQKFIWTANSQSLDPTSADQAIGNISKSVIEQLKVDTPTIWNR
jgi:hypothetical protein